MKRTVYLVVCFCALLLWACKKSSNTSTDNALVGKWTLTETLTDPGNGSGQWKPTDRPGYYYVQFNADSSFEGNTYSFNPGTNRYSVRNNDILRLIDNTGRNYTYSYTISGTTLTITGGCIEACGSRFTRAR